MTNGANYVTEIRKGKRIRQQDIADKLGMPRTTYAYKEETGSFTDAEKAQISKILKMDIRAIVWTKTATTAVESDKERDYLYWQENIAHKLTETRRKEIRRKFEKVITGYKIAIHDLTPFHERVEDVPVLIKLKSKKINDNHNKL